MNNENWEQFLKTGKIEMYLKYKNNQKAGKGDGCKKGKSTGN